MTEARKIRAENYRIKSMKRGPKAEIPRFRCWACGREEPLLVVEAPDGLEARCEDCIDGLAIRPYQWDEGLTAAAEQV